MYHTVAHTAVVSLAAARRHAAWRTRDFSRAEQEHYHTRTLQSAAGALAAKRAAVALFRELDPGACFAPRDFGLTHGRNGAPRVAKVPRCTLGSSREVRARLSVSISHTRTHAYGVAAYCGPRAGSARER